MSRSAKTRAFFGDADYDFALLLGQCVELQELTDHGLGSTLDRIERIYVKDIGHVLRLGLIGGGMPNEAAARLVERHLVSGYFGVGAAIAFKVVASAIAAPEDEPSGEGTGEPTSGQHSPEENFDMPTSTQPPLPQGSDPAKPTRPRFGNFAPRSTDGPRPTVPSQKSPRPRPKNTTQS